MAETHLLRGGGGTVFLEEGNSTISYTTIRTSSTCKKSDVLFSCYARKGRHKSGDFLFSFPPSPSSNGETDVSGRTFLKPGHGRSLLLPKATDGGRAPPKVAVSHRGGKEGSGRAQVEKKFMKTLWVYETLQ